MQACSKLPQLHDNKLYSLKPDNIKKHLILCKLFFFTFMFSSQSYSVYLPIPVYIAGEKTPYNLVYTAEQPIEPETNYAAEEKLVCKAGKRPYTQLPSGIELSTEQKEVIYRVRSQFNNTSKNILENNLGTPKVFSAFHQTLLAKLVQGIENMLSAYENKPHRNTKMDEVTFPVIPIFHDSITCSHEDAAEPWHGFFLSRISAREHVVSFAHLKASAWESTTSSPENMLLMEWEIRYHPTGSITEINLNFPGCSDGTSWIQKELPRINPRGSIYPASTAYQYDAINRPEAPDETCSPSFSSMTIPIFTGCLTTGIYSLALSVMNPMPALAFLGMHGINIFASGLTAAGLCGCAGFIYEPVAATANTICLTKGIRLYYDRAFKKDKDINKLIQTCAVTPYNREHELYTEETLDPDSDSPVVINQPLETPNTPETLRRQSSVEIIKLESIPNVKTPFLRKKQKSATETGV